MPFDAQQYWLYKEPGFFCNELYQRSHIAVTSESEYLRLFAAAEDQPRLGEASALYLFSARAAERIQRFSPEAKIIIALREPVAMMRAWHADNLRHGHECVASFQQAIELEAPRRAGRSLPLGSGYPACLQYHAMATFSEQVERFQACFDRSQIKVVLLDDLAQHPTQVLKQLVEFLGLVPEVTPSDWVHNERVPLSRGALLKHRLKNRLRSLPIVAAARRHLPMNFDAWLDWGLRPLMKKSQVETDASEDFMAELRRQFRPEIQRLAQVIERDLSGWLSASNRDTPIPAPHFPQQVNPSTADCRGAQQSPTQPLNSSEANRPIGTIAKNG